MKKNALTVTTGVMLILYALINLGAGFGQFSKAKMVSGTTAFASSMGDFAGDNAGAQKMRQEGASVSAGLYLVAVLILAAAVIEFVASIGLFSGSSWAYKILVAAAVLGILVEVQDVAEDGFGIGKAIFFGVNAFALYTAFSARETKQVAA